MTLTKVVANYAQEKKIKLQKIDLNNSNTTWFQDTDKYIYTVILDDDKVTLKIFAPSGNVYSESRELGGDGWDITGWEEDN